MLERWQTAETALLYVVDAGTNLSVAEAMLGALFLNRSDGDRVSNLETAKMWFLTVNSYDQNCSDPVPFGGGYSDLKEKESAAKAWR